jgi:hypothetical protein
MLAQAKIPTILCLLAIISVHDLALAAAGDENWDNNFGVPGANGDVLAMAFIGNRLYVGGAFTEIGGVNANRIAQWDGTNWSPLGLGVDGPVRALSGSETNLYVGGSFNYAGGTLATNIAKWDGVNWSPLDSGLNGSVRALAVEENQVFAGGRFSAAGSLTVSNIAVWSGSAWMDIGGGVNGQVTTLAKEGTNLYVGGDFSRAGLVGATNVAKWDGVSWAPMGNPQSAPPAAIRLKGSEVFLFALRSLNRYETNYRLLKWAGTSWLDVASGGFFVNCNDCAAEAHDMIIVGNDLYICGFFYAFYEGVVGLVSPCIAKWDGTNWSSLGRGLDTPDGKAYALAATGSELIVGGNFTQAGGKAAIRIALWRNAYVLRARRSENMFVVSWPAAGSNFVLESISTLGQTNWVQVPQPYFVAGDQCVVTNDTSGPGRFYRLQR